MLAESGRRRFRTMNVIGMASERVPDILQGLRTLVRHHPLLPLHSLATSEPRTRLAAT